MAYKISHFVDNHHYCLCKKLPPSPRQCVCLKWCECELPCYYFLFVCFNCITANVLPIYYKYGQTWFGLS